MNLGAGSDSLVVAGSSGADMLTFGADGVNMNDDGADPADVDMTLANVEAFTVNAVGGADNVSGDGGNGTGLPFSAVARAERWRRGRRPRRWFGC